MRKTIFHIAFGIVGLLTLSCTGPTSTDCNTPYQPTGGSSSSGCSIPSYEPAYWNNDSHAVWCNNCYNYGNNKRTDTFAQPGRASGTTLTLNCNSVKNAALADGLVTMPASGTCPGGEDKVALVVAPDADYHWYRLDSNGRWTHKPGHTQATNLDNSGNPISNPETANRGSYTDFCGYLCSCSDSNQGMGYENIR